MKRLHCILFSVLTILLYNIQASAQTSIGNGGQTIYEPFKQSVNLESAESAVKNLPRPKEINNPINTAVRDEGSRRFRIKRITDNIEELNKASAALSAAAETAQSEKSEKKKTAKLAKKIAALSKDLRKTILEMKPAGKIASVLPAANDGIRRFAENIDMLIKEVSQDKDRLLYTIDSALMEASSKKLETIESQALGIAEFLR